MGLGGCVARLGFYAVYFAGDYGPEGGAGAGVEGVGVGLVGFGGGGGIGCCWVGISCVAFLCGHGCWGVGMGTGKEGYGGVPAAPGVRESSGRELEVARSVGMRVIRSQR